MKLYSGGKNKNVIARNDINQLIKNALNYVLPTLF